MNSTILPHRQIFRYQMPNVGPNANFQPSNDVGSNGYFNNFETTEIPGPNGQILPSNNVGPDPNYVISNDLKPYQMRINEAFQRIGMIEESNGLIFIHIKRQENINESFLRAEIQKKNKRDLSIKETSIFLRKIVETS